MHSDPETLAAVTAWSALATAAATVGLLIVGVLAWRSTRGAVRAAEAANLQKERDSVAQTRPYVFVEVIPGLSGTQCFDLRVRNTGQSPARSLTLELASWPESPDDVAQSIQTMFATPRTLPPGSSIRMMWRLEGNFSDGTDEAGMPKDSTTITARYEADGRKYTDEFDVHIEGAGLWPLPEAGPNGDSLRGDMRTFYRLGQVIARRLGELGR